VFSHFADARIFLGSGANGEAAKDARPPGGPSVFGGFGPVTGFQEIAYVPKMGKRVSWPQGLRSYL
jgi:hypothetical protein